MFKYNNKEFNEIIRNYVIHPKFQETKLYTHHGHTRYEHSLRVAIKKLQSQLCYMTFS